MRSMRIPTNEAFQAQLEELRTRPMENALNLTHSDRGRYLVSKIYSCLTQLTVFYSDFSQQGPCDTSKLQKLLEFKDQLQQSILVAEMQGLDEVDEAFYNKLNQIERSLDKFYNFSRSLHPIDEIAHLNFISSVMYYCTIIASYLTNGLRAFLHSLPTIVSSLGSIFPPITIAIDAAKNIFDLLYSLATHFHLREIERGSKEKLTHAPLYAKGFYIRLLGNMIALALNIFTLIIFTSALYATPLGWALSAAVIAAEWTAGYLVPAWHTHVNYKKALEATASRSNEITDTRQVQLTKKSYLAKRKDALWGFCSIIGSIFFACGFIFPPLFYIGVLFLLASPTRFTINYLVDLYKNHGTPDTDADSLPLQSTSIIAASLTRNSFRQKRSPAPSPNEIELINLAPSGAPVSVNTGFPETQRQEAPPACCPRSTF